MVVCGVKVPPELGAWQGTVPEFVNELFHSLFLPLQPQVVTVACLKWHDITLNGGDETTETRLTTKSFGL